MSDETDLSEISSDTESNLENFHHINTFNTNFNTNFSNNLGNSNLDNNLGNSNLDNNLGNSNLDNNLGNSILGNSILGNINENRQSLILINKSNKLWMYVNTLPINTIIINNYNKSFINIKNKPIPRKEYDKICYILYTDKIQTLLFNLNLLLLFIGCCIGGICINYYSMLTFKIGSSLLIWMMMGLCIRKMRFLFIILFYSLIQIIVINYIGIKYLNTTKEIHLIPRNDKIFYALLPISYIEVLIHTIIFRFIIIFYKIKQEVSLI